MKIDYTRIVTTDLKPLISAERLEEIKNEAKNERNYIRRNGYTEYVRDHLFERAEEIAYVNYRHAGKSKSEKAILAANIVFDDEKFAEMLLNGNFNLQMLKDYINLLNYLKNKIVRGKEAEVDEKYFKTAESFAKRLSIHFQKMIGKNKPSIIINKINELISFRPELLDKQENTHTK